jgi:peptide/nickel transport system permease protein
MSIFNVPPEPPDPSLPAEGLISDTVNVGAAVQAPQEAAVAAGMLPATRPRSAFRRGLEVFFENKLAVAGGVIIVVMVLFCSLGPLFYHGNTTVVNFINQTLPPGAGHPLGTDANGNDVLARLMTSGQISLEVGIAAAILATVIGVLWGSVAGYFGGIIDAVMMRIVDAVLSIPVLFLALVIVAIVTPSEPILILVIAMTSWLTTSRLVRGEALSLRVREYVQAMRVMGGGSARAVLRHIAPNAIGTIVVNLSFQVADAIGLVVALSYLGLGIRPPEEDWGAMLSNGITYVADGYWWLIVPAGVCIVIVITAFIWIGEGLRDAVEVRLQRR